MPGQETLGAHDIEAAIGIAEVKLDLVARPEPMPHGGDANAH